MTLEEVRAQVNLDHTADDAFITSRIIPAARARAERFLNRALVERMLACRLDRFEPFSPIYLPVGPVQYVDSIRYRTTTGEAVVDPETYRLDEFSERPTILLEYGQAWPADSTLEPASVTITFFAGYEPTADESSSPTVYDYTANIPPDILHGILTDCAHLYANRESVAAGAMVEVPLLWESLLWPHRILV